VLSSDSSAAELDEDALPRDPAAAKQSLHDNPKARQMREAHKVITLFCQNQAAKHSQQPCAIALPLCALDCGRISFGMRIDQAKSATTLRFM